MKTFNFTIFGDPLVGRFTVARYAPGGLAVSIETEMEDMPGFWEPYTNLSVWLSETDNLPSSAFYVKNWSENEGLVEQLAAQGLIERAPNTKPATSGFIPVVHAYQLTDKGRVRIHDHGTVEA